MDNNRNIVHQTHAHNQNANVDENEAEGNKFVRLFWRIVKLIVFQLFMIYWILKLVCSTTYKYLKVLFSLVLVQPINYLLQVTFGVVNDIRFRTIWRLIISLLKLVFVFSLLIFLNAKYIQPLPQPLSTPVSSSYLVTKRIHSTEDDFGVAQAISLNSLKKVVDVLKSMDEGNKKVWGKVADEAKEVKSTIEIVKSYFEEKINRLWGRIHEQQKQIESVENELFLELERRHSEFETNQAGQLLTIQKNLYKDIEDTVRKYLYTSGLIVPDAENRGDSISIKNLVESITTNVLAKETFLDVKYLEDMINTYIQKYHQDVLNSADFALKQRGAYILYSMTSSTYHSSATWKRALFMLVGWTLYPDTEPEMAITPGSQIGDCWKMYGSTGNLTIHLSEPIHIHSITVEHPSKEILLNQIKNAPKEMEVYGYYLSPTGRGKEIALLKTIYYDIDSNQRKLPVQSFDLRKEGLLDNNVYVAVKIRILSNWGNPDRTDIYRIRIHGVPASSRQIEH